MVLIAGGTGVLGSRVARILLGRGENVRIMTRNPDGGEMRSCARWVWRWCDVTCAMRRGYWAIVDALRTAGEPTDDRPCNRDRSQCARRGLADASGTRGGTTTQVSDELLDHGVEELMTVVDPRGGVRELEYPPAARVRLRTQTPASGSE